MKLAARQGDTDRMMQALWVNTGLLLTSSHESLLRFWKLARSIPSYVRARARAYVYACVLARPD
jgi:hypothetical protein